MKLNTKIRVKEGGTSCIPHVEAKGDDGHCSFDGSGFEFGKAILFSISPLETDSLTKCTTIRGLFCSFMFEV